MPMIIVRTVGPVDPENGHRYVERLGNLVQETLEAFPENGRILVEKGDPESWVDGGATVARIRSDRRPG